MRRLIARCLIECSLAFAVLALAIPALAPQSPVDPPYWDDLGFAVCELPCWAGITPGITPFDDVPDLISANVPGLTSAALVSGSQVNINASADGNGLSALVQPGQANVRTIQLNVLVRSSTLISRLGLPQCVWVDLESSFAPSSITLLWSKENSTISSALVHDNYDVITQGDWISTSWVNWITVFQQREIEQPQCERDTSLLHPWFGFAPPWRYAEHAR